MCENRQHPFVKRDVTRNHDVPLRYPDLRVAGIMGRPQMQHLYVYAPQSQVIPVLERQVGSQGPR